MDRVRLSKTMAFLLRHKPEVGRLTLDDDGWVDIDDLCGAVSRLMRTEIRVEVVRELVDDARIRRFEIEERRIRALRKERARKPRHPRCTPPDILYHATTTDQADEVRQRKLLTAGRGRQVFLSHDEAAAWRAAHRMEGEPAVLYVDATRARRHGVRFFRNRRTGLYLSTPVPGSDILNLHPGFAHQLSAGGFPIRRDTDGKLRMALIQVTRRSGVTWEVAKGKLEPGEPPEIAAVREVGEEMGIDLPMHITRSLGGIRYGFLAPGGLPRLKTVYLYLMNLEGKPTGFDPATAEGVADVAWFTPDEAVAAVTHSSLRPMMQRARDLLVAQGDAALTGA